MSDARSKFRARGAAPKSPSTPRQSAAELIPDLSTEESTTAVPPRPPKEVPLVAGVRACLQDLSSRPDLNGKMVDVIELGGDGDNARWLVACDEGDRIKVRALNLDILGGWPSTALELPDVDEEPPSGSPLTRFAQNERRERSIFSSLAPYRLHEVTSLDLSQPEGREEAARAAVARVGVLLSGLHVEAISRVCGRLETLNLTGCTRAVDDAALGRLASLPCLRSLVVACCKALTDAGLAGLASGPALESEEVSSGARSRGLYATLGAAMGGAMRTLPLELLDVSGCTQLSDEGLVQLSEGCPRLHTLRCEGCTQVGDRGLCALARNATLSSLDLSGCLHISDAAISTLARHCPLASLRMVGEYADVTPFAIRALAEECGAKSLVALNLSKNRRMDMDATIKALAMRCRLLRRLELRGCERLTGEGVALAASPLALPALELLDAEDIEGIPESVVNDAQAAARSAGRHLVIAHPARQVL